METITWKKCAVCGTLVAIAISAEPFAALCPIKCERHSDAHAHEENPIFTVFQGVASNATGASTLSGDFIRKYNNQ